MRPYYSAGGIEIYHGDCRDVLPRLGETADLLLTDPPYGVGYRGKKRSDGGHLPLIVGDDGSLDVPAALALALRSLRRGRHVYIFGTFDLSALPLCSPVEIVWDKEIIGMGDLSIPWAASHETIQFAVYEISKVNRDKGYGAMAARLRRGTVIRCQRAHSGQVERHPTEKPVLLLRQLIESSSVMGELVLDPFMGSGSTLEAAQLEGRRAIGIEVEERYCEVAARRLGQQVMALEFA